MPDAHADASLGFAGVYLHVPFCVKKCAYCDFVSYAGRQPLVPTYVRALEQELRLRAHDWRETEFASLYFGGGTPSLLSGAVICGIASALGSTLTWRPEIECTIEANPGTLTMSDLGGYRDAGVNRLSLGVQSLHDDELTMLGRIHDTQAAYEAVAAARSAGIENLSLDLMFGVPRQTLVSWRETLLDAIAIEPEHLSLYALTVEEGTPLADDIVSGALPRPDDDLAAEMYELAQELLAGAGYLQYEVSNWARASTGDEASGLPLLASRHNLVYWRNGPYLGLGAAAHSYDGQHRTANTPDLDAYIEGIQAGCRVIEMDEALTAAQRMDETMMLGLRLLHGVTKRAFAARFGVALEEVYGEQIAELVEAGLLVNDAVGIRLSQRGTLLGNRVFGAFLREEVGT